MIKRILGFFRQQPINVLDWGADPTGRRNSSWSIQMAVDEAATTKSAQPTNRVLVPNGTYLANAINVSPRRTPHS